MEKLTFHSSTSITFNLLRWVCQAKNVIKGEDQIIQSEPVIVEVSGRPQILIQGSDESPWYPRDMKATLNVSYCSDPRPRNLQWKWDNLALPEGKKKKPRVNAKTSE